jgi:hypothetical protein
MPSLERGAMVLVPLAAVATLALGLRIGSAPPLRAAVMFGAPPSKDRVGLAWQLVTLLDDRGVREAISLDHVSVVARSGGQEARWEGGTNSDGVAEVWLDLRGVSTGEAVSLEVRTPGERAPLAEGVASWPADATRDAAPGPAFVRPSKQTGPLVIELAVYGGRLAPGFPVGVWIHVRDGSTGQGVAGATIEADAEPGLALSATRATTGRDGWTELRANAEIHVVALGLRASSSSGASGQWYGALPVAPGGAFVSMPTTIPAGAPHTFDVLISTVLSRVYVEVDDAVGRAFAASPPVTRGPEGARAVFDLRALGPGTYWLVTAGDPRAAESLAGAAIARPFVVAPSGGDSAGSPALRLATLAPPRFARSLVLDGLPGKRAADGGRRRLGLGLAFGSLLSAAILETLLILRVVRRSGRELAALAGEAHEAEARLENRFNAASVVVGILIAVLGFALLAALLTWKASSPGD